MGKKNRERIAEQAKVDHRTPEEIAEDERIQKGNVQVVQWLLVLCILAFIGLYLVYGMGNGFVPHTAQDMHFNIGGFQL